MKALAIETKATTKPHLRVHVGSAGPPKSLATLYIRTVRAVRGPTSHLQRALALPRHPRLVRGGSAAALGDSRLALRSGQVILFT